MSHRTKVFVQCWNQGRQFLVKPINPVGKNFIVCTQVDPEKYYGTAAEIIGAVVNMDIFDFNRAIEVIRIFCRDFFHGIAKLAAKLVFLAEHSWGDFESPCRLALNLR
nr:hypothetical protein [Bacteroidota bacterium]